MSVKTAHPAYAGMVVTEAPSVTSIGQALLDTLKRDAPSSAFQPAGRGFYDAIDRFLSTHGYQTVSWALWLDIRGMALAGRKVEAIKLLREEASIYTVGPKPLPIPNQTESEFTRFAEGITTQRTVHKSLGLLQAKQIIDLLIADEDFFS